MEVRDGSDWGVGVLVAGGNVIKSTYMHPIVSMAQGSLCESFVDFLVEVWFLSRLQNVRLFHDESM